MTEIWFIRHGETDWNRQRRLQGWQDIPLNATGRRQAARLATRMQEEAKQAPFHALYSSDLQRAQDTALALSTPLNLPVRLEPGIRERGFGVLEGLSMDEIDQRAPEAAAVWRSRDPLRPLEGGEALRQFQQRIVSTVEAVAARHPQERIVMLTHGGVLDIIWRQANAILLEAPRLATLHNVSINRIQVQPPHWRLLHWGDISHMDESVGEDIAAY